MKLSVSETAKLTGISVRTLHYYHEIGLVKPAFTSDAGYRYYDEEALSALQQVLLYRELDFPLKDIKEILSVPGYDKTEALKAHRELLRLKQERLGRLIALTEGLMKGETHMDFQEFDMTEIERAKELYGEEARHKWGITEAFGESERRTGSYDKRQWEGITEEANAIFSGFSQCVKDGEGTDGRRAWELTRQWQEHITRWYYPCTPEILEGLGTMYTADRRFRDNLNKFGEGTAEFMSEAIGNYCRKI